MTIELSLGTNSVWNNMICSSELWYSNESPMGKCNCFQMSSISFVCSSKVLFTEAASKGMEATTVGWPR